jgi:hypothetical protein
VRTFPADADIEGEAMDALWSLGTVGLLAWGLVRYGGWSSRRRPIEAMLDDSKPCAVRTRR